MDLKSGYPFWTVKNGLMHPFPALDHDLRCDVVVVGGGITGALIAHALQADGRDVAVIERRDIGWGSTSASTALLQYEIDTPMTELRDRYGEADALRAYRACLTAVGNLGMLARSVRDVDYASMDSLYFASRRRHVDALRAEFELRRDHGFPVHWLEHKAIACRYRFEAPAAILSNVAARVDPYRFTHRLLMRLARKGGHVHDRTEMAEFEHRRGGITVRTKSGPVIRAGHLVIAAGYESEQLLSQRVASNRSSYAFVTDPLDVADLGPLAGTMIWETARPYLYMRSTGDHRLIVGGGDDDIDLPSRRDKRLPAKAAVLKARVERTFDVAALTPAFAWAGTFAETDDGLPFFGSHPEHGPRVGFALAYGGNGITYSAIGAGILAAHIGGRGHPMAELFGFARLERNDSH